MNLYEYLSSFNVNPIFMLGCYFIVGVIVVDILYKLVEIIKIFVNNLNEIEIDGKKIRFSNKFVKTLSPELQKRFADLAAKNFASKIITEPLSNKGLEFFRDVDKLLSDLREKESPNIEDYERTISGIQSLPEYSDFMKIRSSLSKASKKWNAKEYLNFIKPPKKAKHFLVGAFLLPIKKGVRWLEGYKLT